MKNLKKIRLRKGLTQSELASKVGVLNTTICNYESDYREPNLETLKRLASELGCTVDELLEDNDDDQTGTGSEA